MSNLAFDLHAIATYDGTNVRTEINCTNCNDEVINFKCICDILMSCYKHMPLETKVAIRYLEDKTKC